MIYFSDFFDISEDVLEEYGAFNISLINDLPLFIDPFLLFGSKKSEYKALHDSMMDYLVFLKAKSTEGIASPGQIKAWYYFPEVRQNWLGYSLYGNGGSGLGKDFGEALSSNMPHIFSDLKHERITQSSHLEKAALFSIGVGKDNISDFTCNLTKKYLLEYTEKFAQEHLLEEQVKKVKVEKVYFDYDLERWMPQEFRLPWHDRDYIILTPKEILTKDDTWINNHDLLGDFDNICNSIPNEQLRAEIQNYFKKYIPKKEGNKGPSQMEKAKAMYETIIKYPSILDYYIKTKEENPEGAKRTSKVKVDEVESVFIKNVQFLVDQLSSQTEFYKVDNDNSFEAAFNRIQYLKHVIEDNDGYKLFYYQDRPIKRETDLQIIYRLTWYSTKFDVNREPNNGRGPVDYSVSKGAIDKILVEFKLASNSQLKRNLENQVTIYEQANNTRKSIKVIMFFDQTEFLKVTGILKVLKLETDPNIILIDAGRDNKKSASKV